MIGENAFGFVLWGVLIFGGIWLYFLPTCVAYSRHLDNRGWIFLGNLLFRATLIYWFIALLLAYKLPAREGRRRSNGMHAERGARLEPRITRTG